MPVILKAFTRKGGVSVFEVKQFTYNESERRIDAVHCDGNSFTLYVNADPISLVQAVNAAGAVIGEYEV